MILSTKELLDGSQTPPKDADAEKAVLGSILLSPGEVIDDVVMLLREADFSEDHHGLLYRHLLEMHNASKRIDVTLLASRLSKESYGKTNSLEFAGGKAYLVELAQSVPTAVHAAHYAKIVHEAATARRLIRAAEEILQDAYANVGESGELLQKAEQKMFGLLDERLSAASTSNIGEILAQAMIRIDKRNEGETVGVPTGYRKLDDMLCGLRPGELIIVAARPGMGKTSFALNVAEQAAVSQSVPTMLFSLEMSSEELADRLLCARARVSSYRMRSGYLTSDERRSLVEASAEISQAPLWIDDSATLSMTEIQSIARRHKRKHDLGLVVVDYLQLVVPESGKGESREAQVAKISRRLKGMARELKLPVLCVAQLNRQSEAGANNRPKLAHLRESGAIEQDADVVLFVHREEYYKQSDAEREPVKGQAEIIVAKQRNGRCGEVKLCWFEQYCRFENRAGDMRLAEATDFGEYNA